LRLLVQRKDRGDPPNFLRDLTAHATRAFLGGGLRQNPVPAVRQAKS